MSTRNHSRASRSQSRAAEHSAQELEALGRGVRRGRVVDVAESAAWQKARLKRNRKAARMLGLLVAAFSVCWLPYCVSFPLSQFLPDLGELLLLLSLLIIWQVFFNFF